MNKEVIITIENQEKALDICVSIKILIGDLKNIVCRELGEDFSSARLYSTNHRSFLTDSNSLYDEKIWDGDILRVLR